MLNTYIGDVGLAGWFCEKSNFGRGGFVFFSETKEKEFWSLPLINGHYNRVIHYIG
jgi:hypothetical protein